MHKRTCYTKGVSTNGYDIKIMSTLKVNSWLHWRNFTINTPRARRAGAAAPPRARQAGAAAPPPCPRFLDGSLDDAMHALEEEEVLGLTSWWPETVVLGFSWCCGWRGSWPAGICIDKTANRKSAGHAPQNPCPLRRALGHKKSHVVTRRRVTDHILFKIPHAQLLLRVVRFLKNYELFIFLLIFRCCFMGPNFLGSN
jgi:hypothetical protein